MGQASNSVRRLVLRPGLRPMRRGRSHWQLGLDPAHARLLPSTAAMDRTLQLLERGEVFVGASGPDAEAAPALDLLGDLVWDPRTAPRGRLGEGDRAALALRDPALLQERIARRCAARIEVLGDWPVDPEPLLAAAGLRLAADPTAVLVLSIGEPVRERIDPLVLAGIPHLLVRMVEGALTLGPLVVPGSTACLRCIDAHLSTRDPLWPLLVARQAHAARRPRLDGIPEPVDSALASLAIAWAVRDLTTHCEGDRPTTWSATVRIAPGLASITDLQWLRHPQCGCLWPGTMEA